MIRQLMIHHFPFSSFSKSARCCSTRSTRTPLTEALPPPASARLKAIRRRRDQVALGMCIAVVMPPSPSVALAAPLVLFAIGSPGHGSDEMMIHQLHLRRSGFPG